MMDLIKQYIVQCITSAANNLRLSTEKIEVVALLREDISKSENLEAEICEMKKVTELSTLAIKLGEIFNYLAKGKIDFLKLTEKFKEHSSLVVKDLNTLLERISPSVYRKIRIQLQEQLINKNGPAEVQDVEIKNIIVEDIKEIPKTTEIKVELEIEKSENDILKEEFILEEDEKHEDILFEKFEERILTPIKMLDQFLKTLTPDNMNEAEIDRFYKIMNKNAELSSRIGFDIISNMHRIFVDALLLIKSGSILPVKEVVESMRACLIVIVAVVKGKEVDITNYLNRAEHFGKQIQNIK